MKNSKEYSGKVDKLFRKLKKGGVKIEMIEYEEPVDSLIYATVGETTTKTEARKAVRRINEYFVDHNELRVSRIDEIEEIFSGRRKGMSIEPVDPGVGIDSGIDKLRGVAFAYLIC